MDFGYLERYSCVQLEHEALYSDLASLWSKKHQNQLDLR